MSYDANVIVKANIRATENIIADVENIQAKGGSLDDVLLMLNGRLMAIRELEEPTESAAAKSPTSSGHPILPEEARAAGIGAIARDSEGDRWVKVGAFVWSLNGDGEKREWDYVNGGYGPMYWA